MTILKEKGVYYGVNGLCLLSALWLVIIGARWAGGEMVSPIQLMNTLVIFAYSLCMVGFNWPDSKRMHSLRLFGLIYCVIMMMISLLLVNDVISFQSSWSYVVSGLSLSLMMSAVFQLYRIRSHENGYKKIYKWVLIAFSGIVFLALGIIYLNSPENPTLYQNLKLALMVYSVLMLVYFSMVAFTVKDDRSKLKK
jgi:FtsH-binding integral membrane protein